MLLEVKAEAELSWPPPQPRKGQTGRGTTGDCLSITVFGLFASLERFLVCTWYAKNGYESPHCWTAVVPKVNGTP